ncbi:MAG: hypothetical protein ACRCYS_17270 [Beijerinckiaceae bacterium]
MTPFDPRLTIIAAEARVKTCHVYHCWQAVKEMGGQFHAAAFAAFAGLEGRHVDSILEALESHDALPERRASSRRGTRLPDDWQAPQDWIDWAVAERRWSPSDCISEAQQFADYWQARSGTGAAKLDWRKTWQNWVRNSRRPNGTYSAPVTSNPIEHREQTLRRIELYERMGRTVEAAEMRRSLDSFANVVPFPAEEHRDLLKTATK